MKNSAPIFSILALVLSSCVYSLFPYYTEETVIYQDEFNGRWKHEDGTLMTLEPFYDEDYDLMELKSTNNDTPVETDPDLNEIYEKKRSGKPKGYKMTVTEEKGGTFVYLAHLFQVKESIYMDLYPWLEPGVHQVEGKKIWLDNLFPVHSVLKVSLTGNSLQFKSFDLDKLNQLFKSNRIRLRHEIVNDEVLITAKGSEIQKFLENYSKDPSVYGNEDLYTRLQ